MTRRFDSTLGRYIGKRGPYKVHGRRDWNYTLCNLYLTQGSKEKGFENLPLADRPDQVTCCNCLQIMYEEYVR